MKQYIDLLKQVIREGNHKTTRGHNTIGMFALNFDFDLSTGNFPLLTTRKINLKSIAAELFCFIHGVTSKRTFRSAGTTIWDEWCNPTKVAHVHDPAAKAEAMLAEDDLGPIYGFQWRAFAQSYRYASDSTFGYRLTSNGRDGDQLQQILNDLRKNPDSRRMVCSAWCPIQEHLQALPPCHVAWNLVHYAGKLNLFWHQRSCDMVLGVPYNIASYALLLLLLAKHAGLQPGCISGKLVDAHIYIAAHENPEVGVNHLPGLIQQFLNEPRQSPSLEIKNTNGGPGFDIFSWKPTDLELTNYNPHPAIKFEVAV